MLLLYFDYNSTKCGFTLRARCFLCFKGCLGALDGTHIRVQVPAEHKGRYRNRKGEVTTNVLGVCSPDGEFIYVLPRWEGSAANGRVLRDAIRRPHGLRVPQGRGLLLVSISFLCLIKQLMH